MDPAGMNEPECSVCGATTGLVGTHHAGWLCADPESCMARAEKRTARAILGELRAEDPDFGKPSDIPAEPVKRVIIIGPHHREEITDPEAVKAFESLMRSTRPVDLTALDPLHPAGRCTCGGEGRCAWCDEICRSCLGDGSFASLDCPYCNGTGYADGLALTPEERAAKIAAIRADEADYAALGYPETETWTGPTLAFHVLTGRSSWALLSDFGIIQKDIRSDTDNG